MRVTVVNHISPEKSVIITNSIDGMCGNKAFVEISDLSHNRLVRKGSGFLDAKGRMTLEFEIRVNYVLVKNILMRWNIYDKLSTDFFVFEFEKSGKVKKLYAKTWLLRFHSPVIARMLDSGVNKLRIVGKEGYKDYDRFLQIVHGVDLNVNEAVNKIAKRFQVEAITIKYETAMLQACHKENLDLFLATEEFNFRTGLRILLKNVTTVEKLIDIVKKMNLIKMSGEIMKRLTEKMFSFASNDVHLYSNKYSEC
uniref:BTB domain-containing protein n=1 Tax=Caenorhabditis japonica TaxID=281687 RepID=A0A8R1DFD1_CAEJA